MRRRPRIEFIGNHTDYNGGFTMELQSIRSLQCALPNAPTESCALQGKERKSLCGHG
ncbi:MAG: galactokinase family protein [Bacilli bacterium]